MTPQQSDVIIIGAGILGLSLAYHLTRRNISVILIEREPSYAKHASGKTAGMFRQLYRHPQLTEWASRSVRGWPQKVAERGFKETGSLIIGREAPGHHAELFCEQKISARYEGTLRETPVIATESDGLISPQAFADALFASIDSSGIEFWFGSTCDSITRANCNWEVECRDKRKVTAPWVVNCAGAWINQIVNKQHPELSVGACPYARHLFVTNKCEQVFQQNIDTGFYWEENADWYLRRWEGNTQLASVCDRVAADPDTFVPDPTAANSVHEKISKSFPQIESLNILSSWFCFRTYADDQLPIWGEDPAAPGLFWLAAFGGLGMSCGFAAAEDAARALVGEAVSIPTAFSPARTRRSRSLQAAG